MDKPVVQVFSPKGEVWATAPDTTWHLRGKPWPEIGVMVEGCWCSRFKDPPIYEMAPVMLKSHDDLMSDWANEDGQTLVFNPDFWRPLAGE